MTHSYIIQASTWNQAGNQLKINLEAVRKIWAYQSEYFITQIGKNRIIFYENKNH